MSALVVSSIMDLSANEKLTLQAEQSALPPALLADMAQQFVSRRNWSRPEIEAYQQRQLQILLHHSVRHSHYYAETIGPYLAKGAPFEDYPSLTKQQVMDNFDRIVTDKALTRRTIEQHLDGDQAGTLLLGRYRTLTSSGSTGQRGIFVYDEAAWLNVIAVMARVQRSMGMTPQSRIVGIGAPGPIHISNRMFAERRALMPDVPRLDVTMPIEYVVNRLNDYQPESIITYPSFIRVLAREQEAGNLQIKPKMFRSAAEALLPDLVDIVQDVWGCSVFEGYACTEAGSVANECLQQSGMHLAEDQLIFESVDDADRNVAEGTQGSKCLITPLGNLAMPLIRYELSDLVTLTKDPCPCGEHSRRILSMEGRREDRLTFISVDGKTVEFGAVELKAALTAMQGIKQYQLLHRKNELGLRIVMAQGASKIDVQHSAEDVLTSSLRSKGVILSKIEIEFVDDIKRSNVSAKEQQFARMK
jgi:phenylacetate-CoA ligase